ncbi:MAG: bifunctional glycosyltransferase family 2 protein/CDP-glycerol:glycerophosphate glycerophosphotransferase [Eubacterium sp.]|nr:bifunctional glycosyltransferase family 2 protein/CDP-glycerol:glycerophosphate glycerophosphotransferase [Eubacterium sp.]
MKVSVIITYHGEQAFLSDCLISLKEQTVKPDEIILVNIDGQEADLTACDLEIKSVTCSENNIYQARNMGIKAAEGDYILFLDADDYLMPEAIALLNDEIEKEGPANLVAKVRQTWYSRKFFMDKIAEEEEESDQDEEDSEENPEEEIHEVTGKVFQDADTRRLFGGTKSDMQNISILGILFNLENLKKQEIYFPEDMEYFGDGVFLAKVLNSKFKFNYLHDDLVYIKRKHNDPVNLPSLLQCKDKWKFMEFSLAFKEVVGVMDQETKDSYLRFFAYKYIKYVNRNFLEELAQGKDDEAKGNGIGDRTTKPYKKKEAVAFMLEAVKLIPDSPEFKSMTSGYYYKIYRLLKDENLSKALKLHINTNRKNVLKQLLTKRSKLKRFLYKKFFAKMKLQENLVMLESFFGKNYSDSPKYIFEYLNEKHPGEYKYVWVRSTRKLDLPYKAKQVKRFSLRYFYAMARAKYFVFNGRQPVYFIKRKGMKFLETWHGTPLKKLVFDMDDVTTASPLYKRDFYIQASKWDYLVAPNAFSRDIFSHAFMYNGDYLETGYPRNDIFYLSDQEKEKRIREIKDELGIDQNKKVILYAPTWRDDEFYGHAQYKFTLRLDLDRLREKFGQEYVIVLRTHYFIADQLDVSAYEGFAYDASRYDDIARLYLISDILITDYSSVFFDYANLRRPMLFFTYDLEKYESVLRGFYFDVKEELPGPMLFDNDEIIDAIENIDQVSEEYKDKYDRFLDKFCSWEDGTATQEAVEVVFEGKALSPKK